MDNLDTLSSWLIRAAILSNLALFGGALVVICVRRPAERLRVIQCVLACCLLAPCLPASSVWQSVSLDVNGLFDLAAPPLSPAESTSSDDFHFPAAVAQPPASTIVEHIPQPAEIAVVPAEVVEPAGVPVIRAENPATPGAGRSASWRDFMIAVWLIAVSVISLKIVAALRWRSVLQRRGSPASSACLQILRQIAGPSADRARVLVSHRVDTPMTWGTLRPVIVLPRRLVHESAEAELRCGLAHEWSHVKHRDAAALWLAAAAQFLCFYHPLFWILRRRMILCQDFIADGFAARHAETAEDYAAFLLRLAQSRWTPTASLALGIVERRSQLSARIRMLIETRDAILPGCRKPFALIATAVSLGCLLLLTSIQLGASADPPSARPAGDGATAQVEPAQPRAANSANRDRAIDANDLESGVVAGRLTDESSGEPVPDATVILRSGGRQIATSDRNGEFRFENVPEYSKGYRLWAHRENLVTGIVPVTQLAADDAAGPRFRPLQLTMKPGQQARFVVTSKETGEPIAGAAVRFGYPDRRNVPTGEDGSATVRGLLPQIYDVTIEAEGYARNTPQIDLAQGGPVTGFSVALVPGGVVRGIVIDEQGQPVPEAEVVYWEPGASGYFGDAFRTNDLGEFRNRFLPLNVPLEVSVDKDDYLHTKQDISLSGDRREREVVITLPRRPPGGSVAGVVTSRGKPLANAQVASYGASDERTATTDASGRFLLNDVIQEDGRAEIFVTAAGFAPERLTVQPGTEQQPAQLNVALEPGHTLRGRVVSAAGSPVVGASVDARSSLIRGGIDYVRTDEQGEFTFASLPEDVRFSLNHPEYPSTHNTTYPLDTDDPVTITLDEPGLLRGQVVDAESEQPVPQCRIRVGSSRIRKAGDARGGYDASWGNPGLTFQADDGRFTIAPLKAGMPFELVIEAEGYERHVVPRAVATTAGAAEDLAVALTRQTPQAPFSLTAQFRDHAGIPIADVQLRLIVSTNQPTGASDNAFNWALINSGQLGQQSYVEQYLPGVTAEDGTFEFRDIVPGRYLQLAYWGAGVPRGRSLAIDETRSGESDSIVIDVPQPARVQGSVDRSVFPDAGSVQIYGEEGAFLVFKTELKESETTYELADLPTGRHRVILYAKPVRYTEDGQEFSRISPLASDFVELQPGDAGVVNFDTNSTPE